MEDRSGLDEAPPTDDVVAPCTPRRDSQGLRAWPAILIVVAYYFVQLMFGILLGVGVLAYHAAKHGSVTPAVVADVQRTAMTASLPLGVVALIAGGGVAFLLTRRTLRGSLREGALQSIGWSGTRSRQVVVAMCLGVLLAAIYLLVLAPLHPPRGGQQWGPLATAAAAGGWQRAVWAVLALLVAPPVEEFVFRGVLWSGLRRSMGTAVAGLVVTVLFVGSHALELRGYWPVWVTIALLGVGTVVMRSHTKSLVPPVALHASYNASLVLFVYFVAAWQGLSALLRHP
jgi:membrane protease YdiL (CAAX protease family)